MSPVADTSLAEPRVSSSIYCAGHVDDLLHRCIAPLWSELRTARVGNGLWLMRYARCGEHVKVRFHGSPPEAETFRRALAEAVEQFFAGLPPATVAERPVNDELFPIDPEDLSTEPYPDRTLRWTTYRRIPGTMGREPLANDHTLAVLFTRCLAAGCEHVLCELVPDDEGSYRQSLRIRIVVELLVTATARLGFPPRQAARYLEYHRDWLILGVGGDLSKTHQLFETKRQREVPDLSVFWTPYRRAATDGGSEALGPWLAALCELLEHTCRLAGIERPWDPEEPYARDQVLAPLFKSLHGLANLVRVGLYNEAYLCHLIARALIERREPWTPSRC